MDVRDMPGTRRANREDEFVRDGTSVMGRVVEAMKNRLVSGR